MKLFRIFSVIALSFFLFLFCNRENLFGNHKLKIANNNAIFPAGIEKNLQPGDLILRSGKGFISDVFRQFSEKDKRYSHAGIIIEENGKFYVYHILGGTSSTSGELKKESLENFCNQKENNSFAVYRYDLSDIQKKNMLNILHMFYKKQLKFDSNFDLATDSAMYCTELVYKTTIAASGKKNYFPFTNINGNKYIAPDNLYLNSHAAYICSYNY